MKRVLLPYGCVFIITSTPHYQYPYLISRIRRVRPPPDSRPGGYRKRDSWDLSDSLTHITHYLTASLLITHCSLPHHSLLTTQLAPQSLSYSLNSTNLILPYILSPDGTSHTHTDVYPATAPARFLRTRQRVPLQVFLDTWNLCTHEPRTCLHDTRHAQHSSMAICTTPPDLQELPDALDVWLEHILPG